ncbi:MAG TPA: GAF domain-containing protein [Anaerolineae bacterium]|nr:GAF domain-containing protein [Anaerolineae bacterium]
MLAKFFRNLSLGVKLNVVNLMVFAPLLTIAILLTVRGIENLIAQMGQQRAAQEAALIQSRFAEADQALLMNVKFLANTPGLIAALADGDITRCRMLLAVGAAPLDFDDLELISPEGGRLIAAGHAASPQEDELVTLALLGIEARGGVVEETDAGLPKFRLVAAIPLRAVTSEILGVLVASRTVDDAFLTEINFARTEDVHLHLISGTQVLAQDQFNVETGELTSLLKETAAEYQRALEGQIAVIERLLFSAANVPYALAYSPIVAGGEIRAVVGVEVQYRDLFIFQRQFLLNMAGVLALITIAVVGAIIGINRRYITTPLAKLSSAARQMTGGDYSRRVEVRTRDEVGQLGVTFNEMADRLQQTLSGLEHRSRDLEQRSRYLEASAQVGHAAASLLDVDELLQEVVEVIRQRFELYYVALFIVDAAREWAVQRAGTGETGQARVARGHRLPVAGSSMIGWCIVNSQARIAQEAEKDEVRVVSPELPDTRSEVALPLRSRGQVIGALSLQSDRPNAFDQAALAVLQTMADQVAVALDNARSFAASQAALEQSRRAYGDLSRQGWAQFLRSDQGIGYRYARRTVVPVGGEWQPEMVRAVELGQAVVENREAEAVLAIPLKVRDQVIGVVNLRKTTPGKTWTDEENGLIETLTEQLGLALESARLYQDTQRRAAREQLSAHVTSRMRESLDLETVLKTAVDEMRQALGLEGVIVQLARPEVSETTEP